MVGQTTSPTMPCVLTSGFISLVLATGPTFAVDPSQRTADMPDSWLVLYNINSPQSIAWASIFQDERGIPAQNMLGLDASLDEHLDTLQEVQGQIITPVRDLLANDPQFEQSIMGIVLGFRLPGHYGTPPQNSSTGGFSIADALQDMTDDGLQPASQFDNNMDNPHVLGNILPPGGRLTKATMLPDHYMVARIAAPDLATAVALTQRAKALGDGGFSLDGLNVSYDYYDSEFPAASDEWFWLRVAVESPDLAEVPWTEFDMDGVSGPAVPTSEAFRFGIYKLLGWSSADFASPDPTGRVLAYQLNSFGAVTVRSTISDGGLYVPNALAAEYAAAIGATGEPGSVVGPFPDTLLAALREGWTLGEAYYLANPFDDWMWNLVGDPFLTVQNWFYPVPEPSPGDGDVNGDGSVDGLDLAFFVDVMTGAQTDPVQIAAADLDGNGTLNDDDAYLLLGPLLFGTSDPTVLGGTGDANGDTRLDGTDILAFVDMLVNGTDGWPLRARSGADMDKDGAITMDDVPSFIDALLQGQ